MLRPAPLLHPKPQHLHLDPSAVFCVLPASVPHLLTQSRLSVSAPPPSLQGGHPKFCIGLCPPHRPSALWAGSLSWAWCRPQPAHSRSVFLSLLWSGESLSWFLS